MNTHHLLARCRECLTIFAATVGTLGLLLLLAILIKHQGETSFEVLFRDIVSAQEIPVYQGLFSQIGVICWSIAAGILLLATFSGSKHLQPRIKNFLAYSLVLTLVLALDDAFLLHESVFGSLLGLDEKVTFGVYGMLILIYFALYHRAILDSKFPLLLLGLGLFALSMVIDQVPQLANIVGKDVLFLLEDGCKLAGILFWTIYHFTTASHYLSADGAVREGVGYDAHLPATDVILPAVKTSRTAAERRPVELPSH